MTARDEAKRKELIRRADELLKRIRETIKEEERKRRRR